MLMGSHGITSRNVVVRSLVVLVAQRGFVSEQIISSVQSLVTAP